MLMRRERAVLMVIDVQDGLAPLIPNRDAVEAKCAHLMEAARELDIPVLVTEQYPKGLGETTAAIRTLAPAGVIKPKLTFSCLADPACAAALEAFRSADGRDQLVLAGLEAHVCVLQTALDLKAAGFQIFVVADAVGSRDPTSARLALARLRQCDVQVVTFEMVIFEWLARAGTPAFRSLIQRIKAAAIGRPDSVSLNHEDNYEDRP
jgi:nicotinamidase-related amidase